MQKEPITKYKYNFEGINDIISYVYEDDFDKIYLVDAFKTGDNDLICASVFTVIKINRDTDSDVDLGDNDHFGLSAEQKYIGHINIKIRSPLIKTEVYAEGRIKIHCIFKNENLKIVFEDGFSFERPVSNMVDPQIISAFLRGYLSKFWRHIIKNPFDKELLNTINNGGIHLVKSINHVNNSSSINGLDKTTR